MIFETFSNPQYNPMSPDILLKDELNSYNTEERDFFEGNCSRLHYVKVNL